MNPMQNLAKGVLSRMGLSSNHQQNIVLGFIAFGATAVGLGLFVIASGSLAAVILSEILAR